MKKKVINTHFTYESRLIIEINLNEGKSTTEISYILRRDRSNIAREIMKHRTISFPSTFNNSHPCVKHESCKVKSYECYLSCKNIETNLCPKLTSSPHVCNSCSTKNGCRHVKYYYKALEANNEYKNSWCNDRIGIRYTEEELNILNTDFYYLVLKTKSIYHSLLVVNSYGYTFKISTIYKQIERNQLNLKPYDLPRRRTNATKEIVDKNYKRDVEGHTYEDYQKYKEEHTNAIEIQMDTVEGVKENNAPVILTLQIVKIHFLFMFKIDSQTADKVVEALSKFENVITKDVFDRLFEILLTDNGKEFITVDKFTSKFEKTNIFYCHPYASYEKGNIENNHELIRRIIPKGISLKPYTQRDFDLVCSHINSLCRKDLDGKCPFDFISNYISLDVLKKLNLYQIQSKEVTLIPELLGVKNVDNIKKYLDSKEIKEANIRFLTKEELSIVLGMGEIK